MRCSVLPPQSNFIRKATVCLLSFIPICAESEAVGMVINMEYLLSTDCLTKKFKRQTAIDNISLHIRQGEIYGLIGKNGAGKTTFLKMISGLSKPTSGDITFFGYHGAERNKVISRIGVLIEAPGLYPDMSAYDNLKLKCICVGLHRPGYIENILSIVGLENVGKKKV